MRKFTKELVFVLEILAGSALFALGFDLFLEPNNIHDGGLSGIALLITAVTNIGTVGRWTLLANIPLFFFGGKTIGFRFFIGSLLGALSLSSCLDLFHLIPPIPTEPLLGALYGGVFCGAGLGLVFLSGASTGGTDIITRLVKIKFPNFSMGRIMLILDLVIVVMTGIVFRDTSTMLYCGITLYVTSIVLDAVIYSFDYSKVALIISPRYEEIALAVAEKLDRGSTYLYAQGTYGKTDTKVVLTAIKRQQLADLKELVTEIDPDAFVIIQESHQVLGEGFARYNKTQM